MTGGDATTTRPLGVLVRRAQAGELEAFETIVERCHDMALGTALGRLGDHHAAHDAVQEAFIDAYRKLGLLRDPDAFPGWLRALVVTHTERARRRGHREEPMADADVPSAGPERGVLDREREAELRAHVEALPPAERAVVAMHHLAGTPYARIAELIGISEQAARGRASRARRRLRTRMEDDMDRTTEHDPTGASRPRPRLAAATALFAAIETGDVDATRQLLDRRPELIDVEEAWDDATAAAVGLQPARHASPLVRAVGRSRTDVVELLLDRGADPDRRCSCAGGESPLWAATVTGNAAAVELLLERGADPDGAAFAGVTPLHVAKLRGDERIAAALVRAGARTDAVDELGATPADWEAADHTGRAAWGRGGAAEEGAPIETGIRAVDVFAPLRFGGLVRWAGPPGSGSLVMLVELLHRLARFEGLGAVVLGFEHAGITERELGHAFAELDDAAAAHVQLAPSGVEAAQRRELFEAHVAAVTPAFRLHGRPPVVVAVVHPEHRSDVEAALPALVAASSTVMLFHTDAAAADDLALPATTTVTFGDARARARLFPAVDLGGCAGPYLDDDHRRVAGQATRLLERYAAIDPDLDLAPVEEGWMRAAQRLHHELSQPFHTTRPFTGVPGEDTTQQEAIARAAAILAEA